MPGKLRMYLPGVPTHVVQRGNNRDACFFAEEDFQFYKAILAEGLVRYGAQLHAYCLMTNHVDLIIDGDYCGMETTTIIDLTGDIPELIRQGREIFRPLRKL